MYVSNVGGDDVGGVCVCVCVCVCACACACACACTYVLCLVSCVWGQLQFVRAFYCSMAVLQRFEPTEPFPFPLLCPGF